MIARESGPSRVLELGNQSFWLVDCECYPTQILDSHQSQGAVSLRRSNFQLSPCFF